MQRTFLTKGDFRPYSLKVETLDEHQFLIGLFEASSETKKSLCRYYNLNLEDKFYQAIEQGIDDE